MAAPTPTARQTPAGIMLENGHATKITPAADPDVSFWERTVQPPGIDGGDPIETTTMHNTTWRTMAPRSLKTLSSSQVTAGYDPNVYNNILSLVNVETTYTVRFPDGSTLAFFGFIQTLEFSENTEGELPTCTLTITPTNQAPGSTTEEAPVLTSVAGT